MASAWAKVWSRLQPRPSSDPPHTEQPANFFQPAYESWVSEQHRTCAAAGGVEARSALKRARCGVDEFQTHLVQLVHFLEPCSLGLGALPGPPAHDGGRWRR